MATPEIRTGPDPIGPNATDSDGQAGLPISRVFAFLVKVGPALGAIAAAMVILGGTVTAIRWLVSTPALAVQVTKTDVAYPPRLVGAVQKQLPLPVLEELAKKHDSLWTAIAGLDAFLRATDQQLTVSISNNTNQSLTNLDVRVSGVQQVTAWSYGGDMFTRPELDRLLDSTKYEAGAQVLRIPTLTRIPPKRTLNIYLWGKFPDYLSFDREQIEATYDGGTGEIVPVEQVTGRDAFVYQNGTILLVLIVVANSGYWLIRRAAEAQERAKAFRSVSTSNSGP